MDRTPGQPWIGRNIASVREQLMWDQDELASAVTEHGVRMSARTLGKIERGERKRVGADEVAAIAEGAPRTDGGAYRGP